MRPKRRPGNRSPAHSQCCRIMCVRMAAANRTVGVRELREHLSRVLEEVRAGQSVTVTHHGEPVASIEPVRASVPEGLRRLLASGKVTWSGKPLRHMQPAVSLMDDGGPTVSDILLAQRGPRGGDDPALP
ncbi:MAG TPA: type II toxin-antitoxin system prevent-host-death family antitoxin [Chloroflexota bacterium]|nr:type II toxin-antitoxin system prevent-host-death family antitoxin [Chloroflexota bacterium]